MIQRVQTIWLLLAALAAFAFTQVPLFAATIANIIDVKKFVATENLLLFALGIAVGLLAITAIFMFKKRPTQLKLAWFGLLGSAGLIFLEVWQIEVFKKDNILAKGTYYWGSLLPIAMVIFFILAIRGIRKDEKLIKSLDRLR